MKRIFIDTNIIIDLILKREPFYEEANWIFGSKRDSHFTSVLSIANLNYILTNQTDRLQARENVGLVIDNLHILEVDEFVIRQAHQSLFENFSDFEDAIQHYCAITHSMDAIITRNEKDFRNAEMPVLSPKKFLKLYNE